jgi:hypothetical protein
VAASGTLACIGDADGFLHVIDISNPASPTIAGSVGTPDFPRDVAVSGTYAYVADTSSLQVVDISNPALPVIVDSVDYPAVSVEVVGDLAYLNGPLVLDISDPASPVVIGRCGLGGNGNNLAVADGHVFVAGGDLIILPAHCALPSVVIDDVTVTEGDSGPAAAILATFTVTVSSPSQQVVTVDYETADGTAGAAGGDYVAINPAQTLTFNPGDPLSQTVSVTVNGDLITELDETFFVNLSNSGNATIADHQGVGTIENDDDTPSITIDDVTVIEGNAGPASMVAATFTVTVSNPSKQVITVDYETADGTATVLDNDYVPIAPAQLTFNPGDPTSQTVTVTVIADATIEPDENFFVNLTGAANATIADNQGMGTIENDDETTAVDPAAAPVAETFIGTNFPNPFAGGTTIPVGLREGGQVRIRVFDAGGRVVRTLIDENLPGGVRQVTWDGRNAQGIPVASGFYVVRVEAEGKVLNRPLKVVR